MAAAPNASLNVLRYSSWGKVKSPKAAHTQSTYIKAHSYTCNHHLFLEYH